MLSLKAQENFVKVWNPSLFIMAEEALSRGLHVGLNSLLIGNAKHVEYLI
jgi:hypothetical protein